MRSGCSRNRGVECRDCRSARLVGASHLWLDAVVTFVISSNESTWVGQANVKSALGYDERATECVRGEEALITRLQWGPKNLEGTSWRYSFFPHINSRLLQHEHTKSPASTSSNHQKPSLADALSSNRPQPLHVPLFVGSQPPAQPLYIWHGVLVS